MNIADEVVIDYSQVPEGWFCVLGPDDVARPIAPVLLSPRRVFRPARRPIDLTVRAQVWDKSGGYCWYCGVMTNPFTTFEVDHIEPVSRGGSDDLDNLVPCCSTCNRQKSALSVERFRIRFNFRRFWFERTVQA